LRDATLLPNPGELALDYLISDGPCITMVVRSIRPYVNCPGCGRSCARVHSRYVRQLADLPWNGVAVGLRLHTRRFFCDHRKCERRIFTERFGGTVERHARRTRRMAEAFLVLGWVAGGLPAARLAQAIGMKVSGDTLLRQLRHRNAELGSTPRVLGIDDWAWRKGHSYGTIFCDLERRKVVDLLPDRSVERVIEWLRAHPGVEIISRDRASTYADAARRGAPQAIQVADRWHLLANAQQALRRILENQQSQLQEAGKNVSQRVASEAVRDETRTTSALASVQPSPSRDRRHAQYERVMELASQGLGLKAIAKVVGLDRRTVRRWRRAGEFPERVPGYRRSCLDSFRDYLQQRFHEGCYNSVRLWHELREQGFAGSRSTVRRSVARLRPAIRGQPRAAPARFFVSPQKTAWLLLHPKPLPELKHRYLEELNRLCPQIEASAVLVRAFTRMVRERDAQAWLAWLESAERTLLCSFARQLRRDQAAVLAALQQPWSNGPVEGQINRLKMIKRQMYGRAKFDLLRQRILRAV
jgi:transposase